MTSSTVYEENIMGKLTDYCMVIVLIGLTFFIFSTCGVDTESANTMHQALLKEAKTKDAVLRCEREIFVTTSELRLRIAPNLQAETLERLKKGEALIYLNLKSTDTEVVNMGGYTAEEPWVKVVTELGVEGWVYGEGVRFYKK